jgi:hypothetical protein
MFSRVIETTVEMPDEFKFVLDYNAGVPVGVGLSRFPIRFGQTLISTQDGHRILSGMELGVALQCLILRLGSSTDPTFTFS